MSTSRGSFVYVHVGQGLLIRHVWMPLMVSNAPYACPADRCTGLLVC